MWLLCRWTAAGGQRFSFVCTMQLLCRRLLAPMAQLALLLLLPTCSGAPAGVPSL